MSTPIENHNSIWESFEIQGRVIGALILREQLTKFGRNNIGFAWMFVEPMLFTIGVTLLWNLIGIHKGSSIPIAAFGLTGYSCVLLWRNMPSIAESAVKMNLPLMYHRNVRVIDLFIARFLLQIGGTSLSFFILGVVFTWVGLIQPPEDILKVIIGWLMMAFFGMALATYIGALATEHHFIEKIWHPFSYIMFPLSGAAFLVDAIPKSFQKYALLIPMVHGSECIRDGYFGSKFTAHYDLLYMGIFSLVLFWFGLIQLKKVSNTLEH